jgi:hypothetical protein
MSGIKSIFIKDVSMGFNAKYISDLFYKQGLATVSRITLIPNFKKINTVNAYIDIEQWHDNEAAYNLVQRIKNVNKEARIIYGDEEWWVIEKNNLNCITKDVNYNHLTTTFYEPREYDPFPTTFELHEPNLTHRSTLLHIETEVM